MAGRPTSAPVRRAAVDPPVKARIPLLFQGQGAGGADVGRVPMSARASTQGGSGAQVERRNGSKQRPASASASGRPPPYVLDTLDPPQPLSARGMQQVRGSFGAWQGKKFALLPPPDEHGAAARDSRVQFAGIQGVRTRLERPSSAGYAARDSEDGLAVRGGERRAAASGGRRRHASFLDKASRKTMIDKIRANNAAQEAAMYEGTSTAAFLPSVDGVWAYGLFLFGFRFEDVIVHHSKDGLCLVDHGIRRFVRLWRDHQHDVLLVAVLFVVYVWLPSEGAAGGQDHRKQEHDDHEAGPTEDEDLHVAFSGERSQQIVNP